MKIAFDFVATKNPSGSKTYIINFLKNLLNKELKDQYCIFITKNYLKNINNLNKKIKFVLLPNFVSVSLIKLFWTQFIFPVYILILKFDAVFSPLNYLPIILKFFKIKKILVNHSNLPIKNFEDLPGNYLKKKTINIIMKKSIKITDHLISLSEFAKKELEGLLGQNIKKKHSIVYLGCDHLKKKKLTKHLKNFDYNERYILSIISCTKYHKIEFIVRSFNKFAKQKKTKIKMILIMPILDKKYYSCIIHLLNVLNLEKQIKIIPGLSSEYLPKIYNNAYLYLFVSSSEVFGLTPLEAMSYNIPVLVSKSSALPEINGKGSLYFKINSQNDFVKKLEIAIKNNKVRKKLLVNAKKNIQRFKWKKTVDQTISIIESI